MPNCTKAVCIFVTTSTQHEGLSSAPINITSKQLSLFQLVSNTQQTGQTDMWHYHRKSDHLELTKIFCLFLVPLRDHDSRFTIHESWITNFPPLVWPPFSIVTSEYSTFHLSTTEQRIWSPESIILFSLPAGVQKRTDSRHSRIHEFFRKNRLCHFS